MGRSQFSALLFIAALLVGTPVFSEEDRRLIDDSVLPVNGAATSDFVAPGWTVESAIEGDINGDGNDDTLLVLIEKAQGSASENLGNSRNRALVVLLKSPNGHYQRLAVAKRLLRCMTCYGMLAGAEGGAPGITITKGVITVEEFWGSRETVNTRLSFRYDKGTKSVLLIGEDIETIDRATGSAKRVSSNFLTRIKLTETQRYDEKLGRMVKVARKKQRIAGIKRRIEDIDYERY